MLSKRKRRAVQNGLLDIEATLNANPFVGLYSIAANTGEYVEGAFSGVSAISLTKATPAGATASSNSGSAGNLIDGNSSTAWVANTGGSGWVEIDLGSTKTIRKVRLLTEQTPAGSTLHDVYVGNSPNPSALVHEFNGVTTTNQWLDATFVNTPPSGRYVRIHTSVDPSWVAWREVEIYTE